MAEKGGIWSFTLQVDLPVHGSSSSLSDPIDEAFRTLFMPGKPDYLTNVEINVSRDAYGSIKALCVAVLSAAADNQPSTFARSKFTHKNACFY
jgi:hypothetical protein